MPPILDWIGVLQDSGILPTICFASKCEILIEQPPPAQNLRELVMAVTDAFNQELGHVADEHIPVEASEDSGDEVVECLMK
jgi:hypothetical protein